MQLEGAVALVTGAGSGLGRALAAVLAGRGARLLLAGRRAEALERTRATLPAGADCRCVAADVTTREGRAAVVGAVMELGRLDLLVNNAGRLAAGPLSELDDESLEGLAAVNLVAPIALARDLLPALRLSGAPRIVNIGSILGDIGHPLFVGYCATKFGLRGASDALRRELAAEGVGVTYAAPRSLRTEASVQIAAATAGFAMAQDDPGRVAAQIVSGIESDRARIYARGPERLFVALQRTLPGVVDMALGAAMRRLARARPAG